MVTEKRKPSVELLRRRRLLGCNDELFHVLDVHAMERLHGPHRNMGASVDWRRQELTYAIALSYHSQSNNSFVVLGRKLIASSDCPSLRKTSGAEGIQEELSFHK